MEICFRRVCRVIFLTVLMTGICGSVGSAVIDQHGQVTGRVMSDEGVSASGTIAFFGADRGSNPADRSLQRIPDRTAMVDEQGRFAVEIQYGSYMLGYFPGEKKNSPGLPEKTFSPSIAGKNETEPYVLIVTVPQADIGDVVFYPIKEVASSPAFTVEGTVRADSGKPVRGITVIAKKDLNMFRPQYISLKTDRSGRYSLRLPPGKYYLLARHRLNTYGRPVTGEYFGIWGVEAPAGEFGWFPMQKDQDYTVSGNGGDTITDADIIVHRIPDPTKQEERLRLEGKKKSEKK